MDDPSARGCGNRPFAPIGNRVPPPYPAAPVCPCMKNSSWDGSVVEPAGLPPAPPTWDPPCCCPCCCPDPPRLLLFPIVCVALSLSHNSVGFQNCLSSTGQTSFKAWSARWSRDAEMAEPGKGLEVGEGNFLGVWTPLQRDYDEVPTDLTPAVGACADLFISIVADPGILCVCHLTMPEAQPSRLARLPRMIIRAIPPSRMLHFLTLSPLATPLPSLACPLGSGFAPSRQH